MNRKIEFRGKCSPQSKYKGEWVTGSLVVPDQIEDNEVLIVVAHSDNCKTIYHVDKDTVGQFTWFVDSVGKEVYEFDIMKDEGSKRLYVVYFNEDSMRFMLCPVEFYDGNKTLIPVHNSQPMDVLRWRNIKRYVIGNIHDNPELIKEDSNEWRIF